MNLFLAFVIGCTFATTAIANSELQEVLIGNKKFAQKFYNLLSKKEGNIFFSPISAHAVLAMIYQGAAGNTAEQFENVLNLANKKVAATGYNSVMSALNSIDSVTLHVANKIYIMDGFPLKDEFKKVTTDLFLSESEHLNFAENQKSADNINHWVESKTNSRIKDLIKADWLDGLTRLVLVNALYFKGSWEQSFLPELTETKPFYISNDETIDSEMMYDETELYYGEDKYLDAKILELPYTHGDVKMVIILPNAKDGIADLEKKLVDVDFAQFSSNMSYVNVRVEIPKFKIETTIDVKPLLIEMGLDVIFDADKANFSEISDSAKQLHVTKVVQKAFIEVNEEGCEAAAATGVIASDRMLMRAHTFTADHPFIFYLVNKQETPIVLFAGRLSKP